MVEVRIGRRQNQQKVILAGVRIIVRPNWKESELAGVGIDRSHNQ